GWMSGGAGGVGRLSGAGREFAARRGDPLGCAGPAVCPGVLGGGDAAVWVATGDARNAARDGRSAVANRPDAGDGTPSVAMGIGGGTGGAGGRPAWRSGIAPAQLPGAGAGLARV